MPHLDTPLELSRRPGLAVRAARKLILVALTVAIFVLGFAVLVLISTRGA